MGIEQDIKNADTVAKLLALRTATATAIATARANRATAATSMAALKDVVKNADEVLADYGEPKKLESLFMRRLGVLTLAALP